MTKTPKVTGKVYEYEPNPWACLFMCSDIETIDKLVFYHYNPSFCEYWLPCKLVNVTCEGTIVQDGLDFTVCENITRESIMQFVNVLADLTSTEWSGYAKEEGNIVTLGETNLAKLTAEDIAVATNKGWTLIGAAETE